MNYWTKQTSSFWWTWTTELHHLNEQKILSLVRAQCSTNSCFWVVRQITAVMSSEEEQEQRYMIQFLHRQGKNHVETLQAIQTTYREALLCIPLSLFLARHHHCFDRQHKNSCSLNTEHEQTHRSFSSKLGISVGWVSPATCSWFTIFQCYQFLWRQLSQSLLITLVSANEPILSGYHSWNLAKFLFRFTQKFSCRFP